MDSTAALFISDTYQASCATRVTAVNEAGIVLAATVFYPRGGGQPGDTGVLRLSGNEIRIVDTIKGADGCIVHVPESGHLGVDVGAEVTASIDWDRRYAHMRMHTGLHLLGTLVPFGVTGGNISAHKSRLDFDMAETLDKEALTEGLNELVAGNHVVSSRWISEAELDAQPELIRTLSVRPPRGVGRIRLLHIEGLDLQPCGGTHVRRTGEIGALQVSKIEKKGKHNRRVSIVFAD